MCLGGKVHDIVGLPSIESLGHGALVGDVRMDERVARVVGYLAEIQMTAGIGKLVDYDQPPILVSERNPNKVRANEPCAARDYYRLHLTPSSMSFSPGLVAAATKHPKNRSENDPAILPEGPGIYV